MTTIFYAEKNMLLFQTNILYATHNCTQINSKIRLYFYLLF